ncbi:MAG: methylated-DNA--[protein]-cysteine S-methyltransferase [Pseudomonadota bacterium]
MAEALPALGRGAVASPLDDIHVVFAGETLLHLDFVGNESRLERGVGRRFPSRSCSAQPVPTPIQRALDGYFQGAFDSVGELVWLTGGTPFQRQIWRALLEIGAGETVSYGQLAERVGLTSRASRAVGAAVGANPVSVFVPCHRVVGANGRLTGYAGGLERKRWLLRHEGVDV